MIRLSVKDARGLGLLVRAKRTSQPKVKIEKRPADIPARTFEIELSLPPRELSPNRKAHWGTKARTTKQYRTECGILIASKLRGVKLYSPIRMDLEFYLADRGRGAFAPYDDDNATASFKAGRDALADAGAIPRDSKNFLKLGDVTIRSTKDQHQGRACLVMRLTEL